jgi:antitoxin ParD1/3/4
MQVRIFFDRGSEGGRFLGRDVLLGQRLRQRQRHSIAVAFIMVGNLNSYFDRLMVIQLTADQENLIERKLQTGQYQSPEEILKIAFRLFEKYEESDAEWLEEVHLKVQEAYEETAPAVDGPTFIRDLRQKIQARM